jgi:dCMP deaminase
MIIIGLAGPICSGKHTVAEYLQNCYGFTLIDLESDLWDKYGCHSRNFSTGPDYSREEDYREANAKLSLKYMEDSGSAHFVVYPITLDEEIRVYRQKVYFLIIGIEAPTMKRYGHYNIKYVSRKSSLANFLDVDDRVNYGIVDYPANVYEIIYSAEKIIFNRGDKEELYREIRALDILNFEHFRPGWDTYFMRIAEMAASRSNCMKRGIGAVIVKDNRLVTTGYNGTPFNTVNCLDGGCERCNSAASEGTDLDRCMCLHAEQGAILISGRTKCMGATLYTSTFPCLGCAKNIVQAGIARVVFNQEYEHSELSMQLLLSADVKVEHHSPIVPSSSPFSLGDLHGKSIESGVISVSIMK